MKKETRSRKITVRLTLKEFNVMHAQYKKSTCREMSEYVRAILLKRQVTMNYRNQSLDDLIEELKSHRRELNALGNNFNQVVKKLNASQQTHELIQYSSVASLFQKTLLQKVAVIEEKVCNISDLWLRSL